MSRYLINHSGTTNETSNQSYYRHYFSIIFYHFLYLAVLYPQVILSSYLNLCCNFVTTIERFKENFDYPSKSVKVLNRTALNLPKNGVIQSSLKELSVFRLQAVITALFCLYLIVPCGMTKREKFISNVAYI